MINNNVIAQEIDQLVDMHTLVQTFEEIAAIRMRKIRSAVLSSREFNDGLAVIYQDIKSSYRRQIDQLMASKNIKNTGKLTLIKRNGKSASVFLSANTKLYGDIIQRTYQAFSQYIMTHPCDVIIIGRLGSQLFEEENPRVHYTYFEFPDMSFNIDNLGQLINQLIGYEKIFLFYGKYDSMEAQSPMMLDVYGEQREVESVKGDNIRYIFEPTLENIIIFFEAEIFASVVEQTVRESELAKLASRMINLDAASENVKKALGDMNHLKRVLFHRENNKKQNEMLSGMRLWKKR
jgi:F0F1-type ATP synthase gamma subunit